MYGSVAHATACRTRELGVRIALGAGRAAVVWTVVSGTLAYVGIGAVAGVGGAAVFAVLVEPYRFEVGPHDPAAYGTMTAAVTLAAAAAGLAPALRVTRAAAVSELIKEATGAE